MNYTEKYVTEAKKSEIQGDKRIVLPDGEYALVEAINRLCDILGVRH